MNLSKLIYLFHKSLFYNFDILCITSDNINIIILCIMNLMGFESFRGSYVYNILNYDIYELFYLISQSMIKVGAQESP